MTLHALPIPSSSLISVSHLNTHSAEKLYNRDDYKMILIKNLDCLQPIDQQENIFPSIIQQEQVEFGIATGRIWKMATPMNLGKSSSENLYFLLI